MTKRLLVIEVLQPIKNSQFRPKDNSATGCVSFKVPKHTSPQRKDVELQSSKKGRQIQNLIQKNNQTDTLPSISKKHISKCQP